MLNWAGIEFKDEHVEMAAMKCKYVKMGQNKISICLTGLDLNVTILEWTGIECKNVRGGWGKLQYAGGGQI